MANQECDMVGVLQYIQLGQKELSDCYREIYRVVRKQRSTAISPATQVTLKNENGAPPTPISTPPTPKVADNPEFNLQIVFLFF